MSAQVKLPVKKKIHWKGLIKLLSLQSIQMYNWPRNLTLKDVFLLDYSCKDTTFWDALWVACQDDSTHQLGLRHLPSGTDVLVVDESGHTLLTVDQGMTFGTRKQGHEGVEPENESSHHWCKLTHHQNATSSSAATSVPSTLPKCQCQKRGNSHVAKSQEFVDEDGGMNERSVSGTTVVSTVLDSCSVSGTSVLSAVPDSHCSFVSADGNALDIPGLSTFFPAAAGSSPVQFDLNSETSRFSGTTSSASQGVAEDHLGFLQYGNGGNWEMFHGEGQSSSDAGVPPFLGDIGSLLSNTYTEFCSLVHR